MRTKSTDTDLVSEADVNAELAIRALLAERRPGDAILGEEGGETSATGESGIRWIVDPLDGTVNYLFQYPQWSVSIAAEDADGTLVGVVWDPIRGEEFAATRSGAPTLNGDRLVASVQDDLGQVLVSTGFAYDARVRARQAEIAQRPDNPGARHPPRRQRRARPLLDGRAAAPTPTTSAGSSRGTSPRAR